MLASLAKESYIRSRFYSFMLASLAKESYTPCRYKPFTFFYIYKYTYIFFAVESRWSARGVVLFAVESFLRFLSDFLYPQSLLFIYAHCARERILYHKSLLFTYARFARERILYPMSVNTSTVSGNLLFGKFDQNRRRKVCQSKLP